MTTASDHPSDYALEIANGSYNWYRAHAIRARRMFRVTETLLLLVSAAIPASVLLWPDRAVISGLLGSVVVVLAGLRAVFHWHENYLRFSRAREAVEAERRLFHTNADPYTQPDLREQILVRRITEIEQEEMGAWIQIAATQPSIPLAERGTRPQP